MNPSAASSATASTVASLEGQLRDAVSRVHELEGSLSQERGEAERHAEALRGELRDARAALSRATVAAEERDTAVRKALEASVREASRLDMRARAQQLATDAHRLGRATFTRTSPHVVQEVWQDGEAARALHKRQIALASQREEVEKQRRTYSAQLRTARKAQQNAQTQQQNASSSSGSSTAAASASGDFYDSSVVSSGSASDGPGNTAGFPVPAPRRPASLSSASSFPGASSGNGTSAVSVSVGGGNGGNNGADGSTAGAAGTLSLAGADEFELAAADEEIKLRLATLKAKEAELADEKRRLELAREVHVREWRRAQHEERSRFRSMPTLQNQYVLLSLIGKGGFSEVWLAFDLERLERVAVKVHQLNTSWSDERKASYIKHAAREYAIHRDMAHPRVVRLFAVFEIDQNAFATVLEHCDGVDLDQHLKTNKVLKEGDARSLLSQIMAGLRYLNTPAGSGSERRAAIIHYDLKPGNILLNANGDVKITDFGLSKILPMRDAEDDHGDIGGAGTSMELTSQGAGTYW